MFKLLRSQAKFFYWLIAITFLIFTFAVWGAQCTGNNVRQSQKPKDVGEIDGAKITLAEWNNAFQNYTDQMRKQYGDRPLTADQRAQASETVWQGLLRNKLEEREIRRRHIKVTDDEILQTLQNNPPRELLNQFRKKDGTIDIDAYKRALADPNTDWTGVESYLRKILPHRKLQEELTADVDVTEDEVRQEFIKRHGRAVAEYLGALAADITYDATPGDSVLSAYLRQHAEDYQQPERVRVEIVTFPKTPSPADSADVLSLAKDVRNEIVSGKLGFAEAASIYSEDPGSKDKGGDLGSFDRQRMVKPFADAAFALADSQISQPVLTQFGYHLIQVLGRELKDGKVQRVHARHILLKITPGEDTISDIEDAAARFREAAVAQGFTAAATAESLTVDKPDPFRKGWDIPGHRGTVQGGLYAFAAKDGDISAVLQNDDFYYVIHVLEHIPAGPATLEQVRARVLSDWTRQHKLDLAAAKLKPAVGELQLGGNFAAVAKKYGLHHAITDTFTATGNIPGVGYNTEFNKQAMAAKVGDLVPEVRTPSGVFAFKLLWKEPFDDALYQQERQQIHDRLLATKQQQAMKQWYDDQLAKADIKDNRALVLNSF